MSAPINRIENVSASVDDVERQMQACQAAGVMIPPTLAWRLLSECRSLLSRDARRHDDIAAALNAVRYPDKDPRITYATVARLLEAAYRASETRDAGTCECGEAVEQVLGDDGIWRWAHVARGVIRDHVAKPVG